MKFGLDLGSKLYLNLAREFSLGFGVGLGGVLVYMSRLSGFTAGFLGAWDLNHRALGLNLRGVGFV